MTKQKKMEVCKGNPVVLGANKVSDGMQFALQTEPDAKVELLLYKKGSDRVAFELPFADDFRSGRNLSMIVKDLDPEDYEYNYRVDGTVTQDLCAYGIVGREKFGVLLEGEHQIRCSFLSYKDYDWKGDKPLLIPYDKSVLYKLHVRGFTKQAKIAPKKRGTFSGIVEMIPYFKELGITAVELMPAYEFEEIAHSSETGNAMIMDRKDAERVNYWGYVPGYYFAPKRAYCSTNDPETEFRDMIRALHEAGIECIMEVYFPGGTGALMAVEALWFWKRFYHVDGFHLSGDGVPAELIKHDGLLYGSKRMFGGVDDSVSAAEGLAEYNPGFLQDMRRYLKSDEGMLGAAEFHVRRNTGRFGTVNYMASQDGFTLFDSVSYNYRHNEENGEDNRDGSEFNYSWNCGVEGPCRKLTVKKLREQQLHNAYLLLLLSQGTPMIYAGDEFGNSQNGNNNAWCQDGPTGWVDWKALKKNSDLHDFVRKALEFRADHPILHSKKELKGVDYLAKGFPDISFHGERAWYLSKENTSRLMGVMYCGLYEEKEDGTQDDFIYVGYNFHWENRTLALPNLPDGLAWTKVMDTSDPEQEHWFKKQKKTLKKEAEVQPRSIIVLTAEPVKKEKQEGKNHASVASF